MKRLTTAAGVVLPVILLANTLVEIVPLTDPAAAPAIALQNALPG